MQNIESIIKGSDSFSLMKHDISTTAGIISGKDYMLSRDIWVKKFNYKGLFNFLFKVLFGSRARRLWEINRTLYDKGLPVPEPLAYIEPTLKQKSSFYISSVIPDSDSLGNIFKKGVCIEKDKVAKELGRTLGIWHLSGAVHGDLKWSNILLQRDDGEYSIFFVDLDQSRLYPHPSFKGLTQDLVRFYRYGLELGADEWVVSDVFPAYVSAFPDSLKVKIDIEYIRNKAYTDWLRKGQRRFTRT